ncbi:MAG TPA: 50S ribosomal protein L10 [Candidatus Binatia bacterium]
MISQSKPEIVKSLKERLERASVAVLTEPRGLTVSQVTKLRTKIRELSGEYKVAKNTLAIRAVQGTSFEGLAPLLEGPTALVFGYGDPIAVIKEIVEYSGQNAEKLSVKGAVLDGQLFARDDVAALAKLAGKDQLRAQLLGVLLAPASKLVRTLNEPGAALARLLAARAEKGAPAE